MTTISGWTKHILSVSAAAALLASGRPAVAEESPAAKHSAEMSTGKTHDQATAATRTKSGAKRGSSKAHSKAMGSGMTHDEATSSTREGGKAGSSAAHSEAMTEGKTHDQATESTRKGE